MRRALAAVLAAGCGSSADFGRCEVLCGQEQACPNGFSCGEDGFCHAGGDTTPCAADASGRADAATDAPVCLLDDPGFMDPSAWSVAGTARVDPTAPGDLDPGEGLVSGPEGSLSQSACVLAPPTDLGLALEVAVAGDGGGGAGDQGRIRALVGDVSWTTDAGNFREADFQPWTVCLGEGAIGPDGPISLAGLELEAPDKLHFDGLSVAAVPPPTCPPIGKVRNGSFADASGWVAADRYLETDGQGNTLVHIRPDAVSCCNCASIYGGLASVPLPANLPFPALSFRVRGNLVSGGQFHVDISSDGETSERPLQVGALPIDWETRVLCLGSSHQGRVITIGFGVVKVPSTTCPEDLHAYVDDVVLVSAAGLCQ